jgi:small nuclear ribonucleoprotein (snRNP)-like protein
MSGACSTHWKYDKHTKLKLENLKERKKERKKKERRKEFRRPQQRYVCEKNMDLT